MASPLAQSALRQTSVTSTAVESLRSAFCVDNCTSLCRSPNITREKGLAGGQLDADAREQLAQVLALDGRVWLVGAQHVHFEVVHHRDADLSCMRVGGRPCWRQRSAARPGRAPGVTKLCMDCCVLGAAGASVVIAITSVSFRRRRAGSLGRRASIASNEH